MRTEKNRPYWYKDIQWLCALLLIPLLGLTFFAFAFSRVTEREHAVAISSTIIASLFSPGGLDDTSSIAQFKQLIKQNGSISPIPNLAISVTAEEIADKSPREIRLILFGKLAEPIYDSGEEGLQALATSGEIAKSLEGQLGIMKILTKNTHALIRTVSLWLGLATIILLVALILVSRGFARLFAPGILLIFTSAPGAVIGTALARTMPDMGTQTEKNDILGRIGGGLSDIAPLVGNAGVSVYYIALLLGCVCLIIALVGKIIFLLVRRYKKT